MVTLNEMGQSTSKTNKIKITVRDKAILEVKVQRDRLKQYQKKVINSHGFKSLHKCSFY